MIANENDNDVNDAVLMSFEEDRRRERCLQVINIGYEWVAVGDVEGKWEVRLMVGRCLKGVGLHLKDSN